MKFFDRLYRATACVGLLIAMAIGALAQAPHLEIVFQTAANELKETNTPGAAIALVSGEKVLVSRGTGVANVESGEAVSADTLFRIGSMTKIFTSFTLLSLAEEDKINLEDPIGKYVSGMSPKIAAIRIRELLTHTSGIRDEGRPYGNHDDSALLPAAKAIDDSYLFTEPGKIFSYSNLNYLLIGAVIESVSGQPFADAVANRVFKPLGMTTTTFRPTEAMTRPLSQGHNSRGNSKPAVVRPYTDNVGGWPAGFVFSSANDLARFAIAFLNAGILDGKQVLSAKVIANITASPVEIPGIGVNYGFGMRIEKIRGIEMVGHGGAIPGFGAQLLMSKSNKVGIIILTNKSGGRLEKTLDAAMEATLKVSPKPLAAKLPSGSVTMEQMKSLVGIYVHSPRQIFEIVENGGKLFLKDEDELMPLDFAGTNHFMMRPPGAQEPEDIVFVRGADGAYLHINGRAYKRKAPTEK